MTIDEFRQLAEAWGADIARWPPHRRRAAEKLAHTPAAATILEEEQRLDRLIAMSAPEIDADRINRAAFNVATAIAADGERTTPAMSKLARWWLVPSASFACAAVVGISLGVTLPLSSLQRSADARNVLSAVLDIDSLELNWIER